MENWDIIAKILNKEASPAEMQEFEAWLKKDKANAVLFEELKLSWEKTEVLVDDVHFDTGRAWDSVQERIQKEDHVIPINGRSNSKWILRVAAILAIGLFSTWYYFNSQQAASTLYASTGDIPKLIALPDGSTIWLNKNTKIAYPEEFNSDERVVKLEGEAFFDVVKNPEQPFKVQNKDFEVKVLGTSFNICAYEGSKQAVVTVESGTVELRSPRYEAITLTKGEVGTINRSNYVLAETTNSDLNFMAWKTRKLKFDNSSVRSVCDAIKSYFGTEIIIEDKTIYNCKFTASFDEAKLQDVLKTMEAALNIKVKTNQNRVTISGKGCE
jgi:transmembrane sensor